jgi:hypothetical protein
MISIRKIKDLTFYSNQELLDSQTNEKILGDTTAVSTHRTLAIDIVCINYEFNIKVPNTENQCGIFNGAPLYCGLVYEPYCHKAVSNTNSENTDQNFEYEG